MANLSPNFTEEEFTYSDTAKRYGIDNSLDAQHRKVAVHTCEYLLEPLRKLLNTHYGCKIIMRITSGYRGPKLNEKVGGSKTSQHCSSEAADFVAYKVIGKVQYRIQPAEVFQLIKKWVKEGKLSVDQCIDEYSGGAVWTHVSYSAWGATRNRKQFLIYRNGRYTAG